MDAHAASQEETRAGGDDVDAQGRTQRRGQHQHQGQGGTARRWVPWNPQEGAASTFLQYVSHKLTMALNQLLLTENLK
jgi:hypothetical protein